MRPLPALAYLLLVSFVLAPPSRIPPAQAQSIPDDLAGDPAVLAAIPVGEDPRGMAVNETTGRLYVANLGSRTVSTIDLAGRQVVAQSSSIESNLAPNFGPEAVAVDEESNTVFVADGNGDIWYIDGSTGSLQGPIDVFSSGGGYPLSPALAFDDASGLLMVTNRFAKEKLAAIDTRTRDVVWKTTGLTSPLGLAGDRSSGLAYVSEGGRPITVGRTGRSTSSMQKRAKSQGVVFCCHAACSIYS